MEDPWVRRAVAVFSVEIMGNQSFLMVQVGRGVDSTASGRLCSGVGPDLQARVDSLDGFECKTLGLGDDLPIRCPRQGSLPGCAPFGSLSFGLTALASPVRPEFSD